MYSLKTIQLDGISWKNIKGDALDLEYAVVIPKKVADEVLLQLEECVEYFQGKLTEVR